MVRHCSDCEYTDNLIYTSMPPQVKCTITGEFHHLSEKCNVEFEPVKHGQWIDTNEGTYCSECSNYPYDDGEFHILHWRSDYCPNCGAKMDGE